MPSLPKLRLLLSAASLCFASAWPELARAEEEFPGALAEAADMACVPTCLMCHTVNPGTASTFSKPLALGLVGTNKLKPGAGDVDAFNQAWAIYAADMANKDAVALIKQGIEPGKKQDVCGPLYGCGATFAHTPARGLPASSAAVVAALSLAAGLWVARRRR